jgi:hypothetical protein
LFCIVCSVFVVFFVLFVLYLVPSYNKHWAYNTEQTTQ